MGGFARWEVPKRMNGLQQLRLGLGVRTAAVAFFQRRQEATNISTDEWQCPLSQV